MRPSRNDRRTFRPFVLLVLLLAGSSPSLAQTTDEGEIRRRIEERQAQAREEASRRDIANFVSSTYWDTPAGRRQVARMRREEFLQAMSRFVELGTEPWETRYDERRRRIVLADEDQAEDLEDAVEGIMDYIERAHRLEDIEVDVPAAGEALDERIRGIQAMVREVLPGIGSVVGGDLLDVVKFVEVRESLARIHALSRSLGD
jgi:hypothetical protein